jgi:tetratricopeptide (TPR) repeat protein
MAIVCHDQEEYEKARTLYEKALSIRKQCQLPNHPDIASNVNDIGYLLCDQGQIEEGFLYFEQAYEIRKNNEGGDRMDLADSFNNMGVVNRHRGNLDLAIDFYTKALDIYDTILPVGHELRIKTRENLNLAQGLKLSVQSDDD